MNKLTVTIPSYNQTAFLERCLLYLEKQTFKDFSIIIADDCSTEDYKKVIAKFPNLKIKYQRNEKNLGAIQNIFHTITMPVESEYLLSLHEDDALAYPEYLEKSIEIMEKNKNIAFVTGKPYWFKDAVPEKMIEGKEL